MADHATLDKARKELEDMYLGIPDDSVNLTFGDLAEVKPGPKGQKVSGPPDRRMSKNDVAMTELSKLPSLDFSKALDGSAEIHRYNNHMVGHPFVETRQLSPINPLPHLQTPYQGGAYDDKLYMDKSGMSGYQKGKGRRPGIPHSNICTICSNYIYMCKHRSLVCGRAYCKRCVGMGMGEMTLGRKCLECLGKKFSERRSELFCTRFKYSSEVMQQELKWAEKGPRKNGERRYGQSGLVSPLSKSPITPRSPSRPRPNQGPSGSPYSPCASPIKHALPV